MKKILIICPWYFPLFHPRPHRWTALAEYWAAQGIDVCVLCARLKGCEKEEILNGVKVYRVGFESLKELFYFFIPVKNQRGRLSESDNQIEAKSNFFQKIKNRITYFFIKMYQLFKLLCFPDESILWYWSGKNKAIELLEKYHFETVITVSMPFASQQIGLSLKKKFPQINWIVDIGDPLFNASHIDVRRIYAPFLKKIEKKVLQTADKVSITNENMLKYYEQYLDFSSEKTKVILPLLHLSKEQNQYFEKESDGIDLGYFGAFYEPVRTPRVLFYFLEKIKNYDLALSQKIKIHIFGDILPAFANELKNNSHFVLHGLKSRKDSSEAMASMDFLINIGNITWWQLPSKIADYLGANRPIIHFSQVENDPNEVFLKEKHFIIHTNSLANPKPIIEWIKTNKGKSITENQVAAFTLPMVSAQYLDLC